MQDILLNCEQYGYKNKTEYIRDCVRARVDLTPDRTEIAETNRLMKRIEANINQILVRLYSTGHIYAEDITEIKRGVNEIWHTLLSIRSEQQSAQQSLTSQTEIRPSTVYSLHRKHQPSRTLHEGLAEHHRHTHRQRGNDHQPQGED